MAQRGQFGEFYLQVVDRFFHALEWRYNDIRTKPGHERESEILASLLDIILADQIAHEVELHNLETALRQFQKTRHDSFTPNKYKEILALMHVEEKKTFGYIPQLFGHISFSARYGI